MAYATAQELSDRVGSDALAAVSDRDGDAVIEDEAVTHALDDASADIDSYLAARYTLPLAAAPAAVKRVCIDIAMYHLPSPGCATLQRAWPPWATARRRPRAAAQVSPAASGS